MEDKSISVVIPTLNSEKLLSECLESIRIQDYPREKIEIIIADGGSTDRTLDIARKYDCKIYSNPLKTGEAGKAVGVKHAKGELIALIDSDNILPELTWLKRMTKPFEDPEIAGTEPLYYTYRKSDGYITRYCALIGANDPLCIFLGNYDRYCLITNRWTGMPITEEDCGDYMLVKLAEKHLPTIGANGFIIRRHLLDKYSTEHYLFDIDLVYELVKNGHTNFAKVKVGIIHIFSGNVSTFIRKQNRRIQDYSYYTKLGIRKYPWSKLGKKSLFIFIIYTLTTFPLIFQAAKGWSQVKDTAWAFHILACWLTLITYSLGLAKGCIMLKPMDRNNWR